MQCGHIRPGFVVTFANFSTCGSLLVHQDFFFLSLMHPVGPELPISAPVACARVCRLLYVLRASHARVQATVGLGTVKIVYVGVDYTRVGEVVGGFIRISACQARVGVLADTFIALQTAFPEYEIPSFQIY
jgi:hypothetical protein